MSIDIWDDYEDLYSSVPLAVMLVAKGSAGEKLYFMHPCKGSHKPISPKPISVPPNLAAQSLNNNKRNVPILQTYTPLEVDCIGKLPTEFGLTTSMLAEILCAKDESCNKKFEMKVDNIRFAGFPMKLTSSNCRMFNVVFVLPANVDCHIVESFQVSKLAVAFDDLQNLNEFFDNQEEKMRKELDNWDDTFPENRPPHPYDKVLDKSKMASMLVKVYEDALRTGVVQCFVDDYIEVGICIQPKALIHNHLAPKNQAEIEEIVKGIRPYHGVLLLEDIWPTPDGNPHVHDLLNYISPEYSFIDLEYVSGIALFQILEFVKHLLLWARSILIYPLAAENVYTSATRPKPLNKLTQRFAREFGSSSHLAVALAAFNPPAKLSSFVQKNKLLWEQHKAARIIVFLLRHQLIMQLHKYCYIMPPFTGTDLPPPPSSDKEIEKKNELLSIAEIKSDWKSLDPYVKEVVMNISLELIRNEGEERGQRKFIDFLEMIPFLHGENHVEDIMFRLEMTRDEVEAVIQGYSLVLSTFFRPDRVAD